MTDDSSRSAPRGRVLRPQPILDRAVQAQIGEQLRALYDAILNEPVPERLSTLVARIDVAPVPPPEPGMK